MRVLSAAASNLRLLGVLVVLVLTLGIGIGLGLAATGVLASHDDPNTIHACVNPLSHVARIVEDPEDCAYYEEVVEWEGLAATSDLEDRLEALEMLLACVQSEAGANPAINDIIFEGCNVHVRNGQGSTDSENATGNLIVGYNEESLAGEDRSGSHNLVVGQEHSYSSYGGFVAGFGNTVSQNNASVSGGSSNIASGNFSSVSGGSFNEASGLISSVSGGLSNAASGNHSSVSGGQSNIASSADEFEDIATSVSGGRSNNASVSGGQGNVADGDWSSISGGQNHTVSVDGFADTDHDWVAGGLAEDS